ncbi:MAG: NUDIX hydrolase [Chloroflexi bacterium CFX4]|jgi:8-oxo-dGTP pyrophosphatase MutT (NUDIX family)|nr:NUDIX hydrolase [Chloroflexi bacterium CFX4]MDL1922481.1 NUDIX hydrolase [Chloroflexi bacterium CFX3]
MSATVRSPAVRAVLLYEGKFLLVQHHNRLPGTIGKWGLPGGRVEASDPNLMAALHRELHEEFAMTADVVGFVAMYTYRERAHHIYFARPRNINFIIDSNEILNITWWTLAEVMQCHANGNLHTGFELAAIRASLSRYGDQIRSGTA